MESKKEEEQIQLTIEKVTTEPVIFDSDVSYTPPL